MTADETYLRGLQDRIFKLLPMREDRDCGENNYLEEYLENLCANYEGAFECYPALKEIKEITEVYGNLYMLKANPDLDFAKWRSTILRSNRLIHTVLVREYGEV